MIKQFGAVVSALAMGVLTTQTASAGTQCYVDMAGPDGPRAISGCHRVGSGDMATGSAVKSTNLGVVSYSLNVKALPLNGNFSNHDAFLYMVNGLFGNIITPAAGSGPCQFVDNRLDAVSTGTTNQACRLVASAQVHLLITQ